MPSMVHQVDTNDDGKLEMMIEDVCVDVHDVRAEQDTGIDAGIDANAHTHIHGGDSNSSNSIKDPSLTDHDGNSSNAHSKDSNSDTSSSDDDDEDDDDDDNGYLMQLYESRKRRMRDYDRRVHSSSRYRSLSMSGLSEEAPHEADYGEYTDQDRRLPIETPDAGSVGVPAPPQSTAQRLSLEGVDHSEPSATSQPASMIGVPDVTMTSPSAVMTSLTPQAATPNPAPHAVVPSIPPSLLPPTLSPATEPTNETVDPSGREPPTQILVGQDGETFASEDELTQSVSELMSLALTEGTGASLLHPADDAHHIQDDAEQPHNSHPIHDAVSIEDQSANKDSAIMVASHLESSHLESSQGSLRGTLPEVGADIEMQAELVLEPAPVHDHISADAGASADANVDPCDDLHSSAHQPQEEGANIAKNDSNLCLTEESHLPSHQPFSHTASPDSEYDVYALLVDNEQDDRAVEIPLYTASRPHMRAFHFAWISFFIAFFTWFAMTPLLSEIARSLDLSRKEIWTSSTLAVAGSAVTRILIGPINDIYGARWCMFGTLLVSAAPSLISGLVIHNSVSLYMVRLVIGVAGSAFVTCQYWTTSIFTTEVAGTANSLAAGWGNLGGGVAQVVMGSLLFPLFKLIYGGNAYGNTASAPDDDHTSASIDVSSNDEFDRPSDLAWRTVMVFPGLASLVMAFVCIRYSDDCPKGNFRARRLLGLMRDNTAMEALVGGAANWNTWCLFIQYGCCFGVEITMTNAAALYFQEEFGQSTESAAAIASIFGWMNLFARSIGGLSSDIASSRYGMRGRLWVQTLSLLAEGGLVCLFSITDTMAMAILVMVVFSIFVQAAEGSTFGIVPYVDHAVTGSVSGIVGAGGNVGGVAFSLIFRQRDNRTALLWMGCIVLISSLVSALVHIPGHRSMLRGDDAVEVRRRRAQQNEQFGRLPNVDFHRAGDEDPRISVRRSEDNGMTQDAMEDVSSSGLEEDV